MCSFLAEIVHVMKGRTMKGKSAAMINIPMPVIIIFLSLSIIPLIMKIILKNPNVAGRMCEKMIGMIFIPKFMFFTLHCFV
ncbi:MAG: hypothetical protein LBR15_05580 [Methanobrevibacter sp.]|jgi:hypothetical protein|nr:hypothetical protein [Candidatus Methanovirga australis]